MIYGKDNNTERSVSPVKKFLEWKEGGRRYYNKETQSNENYDFKDGVVLRIGATVKGWSDTHQTGIWSNEIIGKEKFSVKISKKNKDGKREIKELYNGYWSDVVDASGVVVEKGIKLECKAAGGVYYQVLTVLDGDEIIGILLKGSALGDFSEFKKDFNPQKNKIEFNGFTDEKKGVTKYTVPHWKTGTAITSSENAKALDAAKLVDAYYQGVVPTVTVEEEDDLPF